MRFHAFFLLINYPIVLICCHPTSPSQRTPNFLGVIPGGQSFAVPESNLTNVQSEGTGFSWTPSIRAGTTLILVGGDNRGNGSAGSTTNLISSGINNDISCLSDSSPSSTAGNPAGGSYPTSKRFVYSLFFFFVFLFLIFFKNRSS